MGFETWMKAVDAHIIKLVGLSADDIPDWCYWDSWNEGMTPVEAAVEALVEAGWTEGVIND